MMTRVILSFCLEIDESRLTSISIAKSELREVANQGK